MDWTSLIGSVGFPIVACFGVAWYVKYITDNNTKTTKELNEQHTQVMLAYKDELKDAINNNTVVMQRLCDKLNIIENERGEKDENIKR